MGKIAIGCLFGAVGVACLALSRVAGGRGRERSEGRRSAGCWPSTCSTTIGFANRPAGGQLQPFYARSAPRAIAGSIVGLYYLHLFAGNLFVGWLGGQLEKMPAARFWLIHAAQVRRWRPALVFFLVRLLFGAILLRPPASSPRRGGDGRRRGRRRRRRRTP